MFATLDLKRTINRISSIIIPAGHPDLQGFTFQMKKALLLWILPLAFFSCMNDEVGGVMIKDNTAQELLCVAENAGVVSFYASGKWTASVSAPWLSVDPQQGHGGESLQAITVKTTEMNRTGEKRVAALTISSEGKSEVLEVIQRGEYAIFEVHEVVMSALGGPVNVNYETNVEKGKLKLYCTSGMKSWIEAENPTEANTLNFVKLHPNLSTSQRDGYLYLMIETEGDHPQRLELDALHVIQRGIGHD